MRRSVRRRRRFLPGFLVTTLWMIPVMCAAAAGGFFFATHFVAGRYLNDSEPSTRPHLENMMSPEEQANYSKDQDSHVWKDGVQRSDIPRLEADRASDDDSATATRRKPRTQRRTAANIPHPVDTPGGDSADANDTTPAPAASPTTTPDTASPAGD